MQLPRLTGPAPRIRIATAEQRLHPLRRPSCAIAQRVGQQAIRVPIGVAAVTAHPVLERDAAIEEQQFAALGGGECGLRAERDRASHAGLARVDERE